MDEIAAIDPGALTAPFYGLAISELDEHKASRLLADAASRFASHGWRGALFTATRGWSELTAATATPLPRSWDHLEDILLLAFERADCLADRCRLSRLLATEPLEAQPAPR